MDLQMVGFHDMPMILVNRQIFIPVVLNTHLNNEWSEGTAKKSEIEKPEKHSNKGRGCIRFHIQLNRSDTTILEFGGICNDSRTQQTFIMFNDSFADIMLELIE